MDDVDMARSPIVLIIAAGAALLLFYLLFRSSRKAADQTSSLRRNISYECVTTPIVKADATLRGKFPALAALASEDGVELVRFGLFNWSESDLMDSQITEPFAARFRRGQRGAFGGAGRDNQGRHHASRLAHGRRPQRRLPQVRDPGARHGDLQHHRARKGPPGGRRRQRRGPGADPPAWLSCEVGFGGRSRLAGAHAGRHSGNILLPQTLSADEPGPVDISCLL